MSTKFGSCTRLQSVLSRFKLVFRKAAIYMLEFRLIKLCWMMMMMPMDHDAITSPSETGGSISGKRKSRIGSCVGAGSFKSCSRPIYPIALMH